MANKKKPGKAMTMADEIASRRTEPVSRSKPAKEAKPKKGKKEKVNTVAAIPAIPAVSNEPRGSFGSYMEDGSQ